MKKSDPWLALFFTVFLLVLWLGFSVHRDARFAGSAAGAVFAIAGSLLLFIPLLYSVIKRIPGLKTLVTGWISFSTLLTIHIYSGFIGAILVVVHTGHKFDGILATTLTALLLIVVFSGYTGHYLLGRISKDVSEQKTLLAGLESQYARQVVELHSQPEEKKRLSLFTGFFSRLFAPAAGGDVFRLAESIADVEYSLSTHALFKRIFSAWLKIHIGLSLFFYLLLAAHIGGAFYFGLRWLR